MSQRDIKILLFLFLFTSCSHLSGYRKTSSPEKYIYDDHNNFTAIGLEINTSFSPAPKDVKRAIQKIKGETPENDISIDIVLGVDFPYEPKKGLDLFAHWVAGQTQRPAFNFRHWNKIDQDIHGPTIVFFKTSELTKLFLTLIRTNREKKAIHFSLDSFNIRDSFLDEVFSKSNTSKEFRAIINNEELFHRTLFYKEGKVVDANDIKETLIEIDKELKEMDENNNGKSSRYLFLPYIYE